MAVCFAAQPRRAADCLHCCSRTVVANTTGSLCNQYGWPSSCVKQSLSIVSDNVTSQCFGMSAHGQLQSWLYHPLLHLAIICLGSAQQQGDGIGTEHTYALKPWAPPKSALGARAQNRSEQTFQNFSFGPGPMGPGPLGPWGPGALGPWAPGPLGPGRCHSSEAHFVQDNK